MARVLHGSVRKWAYIISFTGTVILAVALTWQGRSLTKTEPDPGGQCSSFCYSLPPIVAFEFAGTSDCAREFVDKWKNTKSDINGQPLIETAKQQVWLDMPFTFFYPLFFALICGSAAGLWSGWFKRIGGWISWAVIAACPLDLVENFALLQTLNGALDGSQPAIAAVCALIKFSLLGLVIGYVAISLLALPVRYLFFRNKTA